MGKSPGNKIYEFEDFRLDAEHLMLYRSGKEVPLAPKAIETLLALLERPREIVSKDDLIQRIWPDAFVDESNLFLYLSVLRKTLGTRRTGEPWIETLRRRGYRFTGDVRVANVGSADSDRVRNVTPEKPPYAITPVAGRALGGRWLTVGLVGISVTAIVMVAVKYWPTAKPQLAVPSITQKRLTTEGGATRTAISRDGKRAAVVQNGALVLFDLEREKKELLIAAQSAIRIVTVEFTPDNESIYYGTRPSHGTLVTILRRSIDAGSHAEEILSDVYGFISFSPAGEKFVFVRHYPELKEYALLVSDKDGKNISKLASSPSPNQFEGAPAWSPDGSTVAVPGISVDGGFHHTIALIDINSGEVNFIPGQRWAALTSLSWLSDSRTMMIAAQAENTSELQVWRVDTGTGSKTRVTNDNFAYETISAASDGRRVLAVKVRESSHVWVVGEQQKQLTAGFDSKDGAHGLGWLPDGRILYHSIVSGRDAIWRADADGSGISRVVDDAEGGFSVSPDGQWLIFQAKQQTDHLGLKAINLIDGTTRELTHGVTAEKPSFFPDGKRIAFSQYVDTLTLQETTVDGGPPKPLSQEFRSVHSPAVSPSGRSIAFAFQRTTSSGVENGIAILEDASKRIVATHPVAIPIGGRYEEPTVGWSVDESEVYFIQLANASVSNVMRLRLADGSVSNFTSFPDGRIFNFAVEPGGTRMLIARGQVERDATLLQIAQ